MPDGDEIQRFRVDTSDADAKLRALEAQFAKLRGQMESGAGGAEAVAKDAGATERAAAATDRLRGGKEKLAAVLNLTGSHLGETASRLAHVTELLLLANRAVLGFTAGAAAIGVVVGVVRELDEAHARYLRTLEHIAEVEQKLREERAKARAEMATAEGKVGLFGTAADDAALMRSMVAQRNVPEDLARSAVIAQRRGGLSDDQREAFLAGLIASGGSPAEFTGNAAQDRATIDRFVQRGGAADAQGAAAAFLRDRGARTMREATDRAGEEAFAWRSDLNPAARNAIKELAGIDDPERFEARLRELVTQDRTYRGWWGEVLASVWLGTPVEFPDIGGKELHELRALTSQVRQGALRRMERGGESAGGMALPSVNIGQQIVLDPFGRRVRRDPMTDRSPR